MTPEVKFWLKAARAVTVDCTSRHALGPATKHHLPIFTIVLSYVSVTVPVVVAAWSAKAPVVRVITAEPVISAWAQLLASDRITRKTLERRLWRMTTPSGTTVLDTSRISSIHESKPGVAPLLRTDFSWG